MKKLVIKGKSAQQTMGLPFSLIFSILLIVVFVVIAFMAIRHFLSIGRCAGVGQFYDDLQVKVDEAWRAQSSDFKFNMKLPSGVQRICFANLSAQITNREEDYEQIKNYDVYEANVFLLPSGKVCNMPYKLIEHIDISKITSSKNPYCVDISRELRIKKDFYDKLVIIT